MEYAMGRNSLVGLLRSTGSPCPLELLSLLQDEALEASCPLRSTLGCQFNALQGFVPVRTDREQQDLHLYYTNERLN